MCDGMLISGAQLDDQKLGPLIAEVRVCVNIFLCGAEPGQAAQALTHLGQP